MLKHDLCWILLCTGICKYNNLLLHWLSSVFAYFCPWFVQWPCTLKRLLYIIIRLLQTWAFREIEELVIPFFQSNIFDIPVVVLTFGAMFRKMIHQWLKLYLGISWAKLSGFTKSFLLHLVKFRVLGVTKSNIKSFEVFKVFKVWKAPFNRLKPYHLVNFFLYRKITLNNYCTIFQIADGHNLDYFSNQCLSSELKLHITDRSFLIKKLCIEMSASKS